MHRTATSSSPADSQAELQNPAQRVCGAEIVNAGVSGASASVYADLVANLSVKTRPRAVVAFIGTNDLLRKKEPLSDRTAQIFDESVERIVKRLQAESDRVVVAAIPPISRSVQKRLEPAAVAAYSARIRVLCERLSCVYADPFAELRDGNTGFALPGTLRDDLHIAGLPPRDAGLGARALRDEALIRPRRDGAPPAPSMHRLPACLPWVP